MASTTTIFNQELMENFHYSRRLLPIPTTLQQYHLETTVALPPATGISHDTTDDQPSFDANVVMVLSVLICSIICSLIVNCLIKCALRCASRVLEDSSSTHTNPSVAKLANTGIKKKALKAFPVITYTTELKYPGIGTECVICLSEFGAGEKVKVLPKCNHGFHVKCIDKWLNSHSSCPICRHCLIETCQKVVNGGSSITTTGIPNTQVATNTTPSAAVQEIVIGIESLQHEGVISNNLS